MHCGSEAVRLINGLHDAINAKLGKRLHHPADLRYLTEKVDKALAKATAGSGGHRRQAVAEPKVSVMDTVKALPFSDREHLYALFLDRPQGRVVATHEMSIGGPASAPVPMAEIMEEARRHKAGAAVLVHNHPSGATMPSIEDVQVTNAARREAKRHGFVLQDHYIRAGDTVTSIMGAAA